MREAFLKQETKFTDLPAELQLRIANEARTPMTAEQRKARQMARREFSLKPLPGVVSGWPLLRVLCKSTKRKAERLVTEVDLHCTRFEVEHGLMGSLESLLQKCLTSVTSISVERGAQAFGG